MPVFLSMESILSFLLKVINLKKEKRTPYKWLGIKNPETIAQHNFRVALMAWLFAKDVFSSETVERVIETAIFHDLPQAETGDMTPYWGILPKDDSKKAETLGRWLRMPKKKKEKKEKKRQAKEKKALLSIIKPLSAEKRKTILNLWLTYQKFCLAEGKFVREIEEIETLLQALSYQQKKKTFPIISWWEEVVDLVDIPELGKLLVEIDSFYNRGKKATKTLSFVISLAELKNKKINIGCQEKITVADYSFLLSITTWIFAKRNKGKFDTRRMVKIALVSQLDKLFTGGKTVKVPLLAKGTIRAKLKVSEEMKKKERNIIKNIKKIVPDNVVDELSCLLEEYKKGITPEALFVRQASCLLLVILCCQEAGSQKKNCLLWLERARVSIDNREMVKMLALVEEKYLKNGK